MVQLVRNVRVTNVVSGGMAGTFNRHSERS